SCTGGGQFSDFDDYVRLVAKPIRDKRARIPGRLHVDVGLLLMVREKVEPCRTLLRSRERGNGEGRDGNPERFKAVFRTGAGHVASGCTGAAAGNRTIVHHDSSRRARTEIEPQARVLFSRFPLTGSLENACTVGKISSL